MKLVGVTSQQTSQIFNEILSNTGLLANQSKQFPDAIASAAALAPGLIATLSGLNLPIEQASQEIRALLAGEAGPDVQIGRALGLGREQLQQLRSQGKLVDALVEKFQPFLAAQEKASRSVEGITSNIQDLVEVTARSAGQPLFTLLVDQLQQLFDFLEKNKGAIEEFAVAAVQELSQLIEAALNTGNAIAKDILPALQDLGSVGAEGAKLVVDGLTGVAEVAQVIGPGLAGVIKYLTFLATTAVRIVEVSQEAIAIITGGTARGAQAVEAYGAATKQLTDEATSSQDKLRDAIAQRQEAERNGTVLTDQQVAAQQAAVQSVEGNIEALEKQRDALQGAQIAGRGNKEEIQAQIASIDSQIQSGEKLLNLFGRLGGGLRIQSKAVQELGNTFEQLDAEVERAKKNLADATTQEAANDAAKRAVELITQRRQLGQISAQEAQQQLQEISENTRVGYEVQISAQEALTKVQETEGDRRVQAIQQQENEIQRLQAEGKLTDAEAERQLTEVKVRELQARLENVRQFLKSEEDAGRGNGERAIALRQQEAEIITQIAQAQAEAEKKALEERLKEIERVGKEAIAAATLAETERQTELQQLINSGVLSEEDANQRRLASTRQRIQAELAAEQQKLEQLRALPQPTDPDEQRALQEQIRDQIQKTADLQLKLLENERAAQEAQAQAAIQAIRDQAAEQDRASQRKIASIEREKAAQDAAANALQRQSNLLQAQQGLQQALSNLAQTRSQFEIDRLQQALQLRQQISQAEDAGTRRVLEAQLRRLGVSGSESQIADRILAAEQRRAADEAARLQQQQAFAVQANELEIKRNELLAQRAVTEARIAELRAQQELISKQADLQAAQEIVDPAERERAVAAAQAQIDLSQQGVDLAKQATSEAIAQRDAQAQIADLSRQTLDSQQQAERLTSAQARNNRLSAAELSRAETSARNLNRSLTSATRSIGVNTSTASVPAFKDGGVASPGVALVGESGPELIRIGSTSRIWSNEDSQKLAPELFGTTPMSAVAPAAAPIMGDTRLLSEIQGLRKDLKALDPGVRIESFTNSSTYQVPRDSKALAEFVEKSQVDLLNTLRYNLGGY